MGSRENKKDKKNSELTKERVLQAQESEFLVSGHGV